MSQNDWRYEKNWVDDVRDCKVHNQIIYGGPVGLKDHSQITAYVYIYRLMKDVGRGGEGWGGGQNLLARTVLNISNFTTRTNQTLTFSKI